MKIRKPRITAIIMMAIGVAGLVMGVVSGFSIEIIAYSLVCLLGAAYFWWAKY